MTHAQNPIAQPGGCPSVPAETRPEFVALASRNFIGSGDRAWLIVGRIPGDDDDTAMLVKADDWHAALDAFQSALAEQRTITPDSLAALIQQWGSAYIITTVEDLGPAVRPCHRDENPAPAPLRVVVHLSSGGLDSVSCAQPVEIVFVSHERDDLDDEQAAMGYVNELGQAVALRQLASEASEDDGATVRHYFDQWAKTDL